MGADDLRKNNEIKEAFLKASMLVMLSIFWLYGCDLRTDQQTVHPPMAEEHWVEVDWHGERVRDPYHYLANTGHPDTQRYLHAEATWLKTKAAEWAPLRQQLATALDQYLTTDVKSTPWRMGDVEIYNEQGLGEQYPVFYQRHLPTGHVRVLLDVNQLAAGQDYFRLGGFSLNADASRVAYTQDLTGDERYTLKVFDLESQLILPALVQQVSASVAWLGEKILYVVPDKATVGSLDPVTGEQTERYQETDARFVLSLSGAENGHVLLTAESADSVEIRLYRTNEDPMLIAPRQPGHRYRVQLRDGELTVLSNARSSDYELAVMPVHGDRQVTTTPGLKSALRFNWLTGIEGQLLDFERVHRAIAVHRRIGLTDAIVLLDLDTGRVTEVIQQAPGDTLQLLPVDPSMGEVRFQLNGLNRPTEAYRYSLHNKQTTMIAQTPLPTGFDPARYETAQHWITARDGTQIPVTLMFKPEAINASLDDLSQRPLLLTAYGAYGISVSTRFEPWRFPLLDQGFVFGLVHVRGGADLGSDWHSQGSGLLAVNSVNDFVDVTRGLVGEGIGDEDKVFARGTSAGGTLVAAALNAAPELFAGVVLRSAFLDLLNALDERQTAVSAGDFDEWGNPKDLKAFTSIRALSPYENMPDAIRSDVLLLAAANDQRVPNHESLKWLARARASQRPSHLMLIDIDNDSGHLGITDQYKLRRQVTLELSFLLNRAQR